MDFSLEKSVEILSGTPLVLQAYLGHLSDDWLESNEGENTWSPLEVVTHLVLAEKTNWIPRAQIILSDDDKAFKPFARSDEQAEPATIATALAEFARLRAGSISTLTTWRITEADLKRTGVHPEFGVVTLSQLLSTWTVHDLSHIAQISRVMAKQYKASVGPWTAYLRILQ
jgi:hypothetical protein